MKHEIYIDKDGLQYVDNNLRFTEFHKYLYSKSFILHTVIKTLDLMNITNENKTLFIRELERQIDL